MRAQVVLGIPGGLSLREHPADPPSPGDTRSGAFRQDSLGRESICWCLGAYFGAIM